MSDTLETESCTIPRKPVTRDIPRDHVGDMQQRDIVPLDLEGCNVFTITMAMLENERASGLRFEQWPAVIQHKISEFVEDWQRRNPNVVIRGMTQGIHDRCCTLALHWVMK